MKAGNLLVAGLFALAVIILLPLTLLTTAVHSIGKAFTDQ